MRSKLSKFDRKCLKKAIDIAEETYKAGINYPVGAVLCIEDKIIGSAGNGTNKHKSLVKHAENTLIIKNGRKLFEAMKKNQTTALYSTLEPCIQCLGACVNNKVRRILYIQKDPNGGACEMKHDNIGSRYQEFWPEIIHAPISKNPKRLMVAHFKSELRKGNHVEWSRKMLGLLKNV